MSYRKKLSAKAALLLALLFIAGFALGFYLITRQNAPVKDVRADFEIHFLDIGQGDAALVLCGGKAMLIDGGEYSQSSRLISAVKRQSVEHLDCIVCTHAHSDHAGGLSAAVENFSPDYAAAPDPEEYSREMYLFKAALKEHNIPLQIVPPGESFMLGDAQIRILGPMQTVENLNDDSMVLQITYGDISVLFMGDAGFSEEADLLSAGLLSQVTVLKVGHHGAEASTGEDFLNCIRPRYAVISSGIGNDYGHPHKGLLDRLRAFNVKTFRTDLQGEITMKSDGKTVNFEVQGAPDADTLSPIGKLNDDVIMDYVVNRNSGLFHKPDCTGAQSMKEENRMDVSDTRKHLIEQGYKPCGRCNP